MVVEYSSRLCVVCRQTCQQRCPYCEKRVCEKDIELAAYFCWKGPLLDRKDTDEWRMEKATYMRGYRETNYPFELHCLCCGEDFRSRSEDPDHCGKCKSAFWDKEPRKHAV